MKYKSVWIGGIIGLIVGLFSILLFETKVGVIFLYPLMIINKFFLHIGSAGEGAGPLFILVHLILWSLIGIIIGFGIHLIKRCIENEI